MNPPLNFQILQSPLRLLPLVFTVSTDAVVALQRISKFLVAEELAEPYVIDSKSEHAIDVDGDFAWETAHKPEESKSGRRGAGGRGGGRGAGGRGGKKGGSDRKSSSFFRRRKDKGGAILPTTAPAEGEKTEKDGVKEEEKPFALNNLVMKVPRSAFVAIVGTIGSGKVCTLRSGPWVSHN